MPGEAKHTPGPWRYDEDRILFIAPDGLHIFRCGQSEEERAANHRLIAAAPDLLAALVDLLERCDVLTEEARGWDEDPIPSGLLATARAAVAKALGREGDRVP